MENNLLNRPVCVLGLGLIGGSLLRDLAAAGAGVHGFDRDHDCVAAARAAGFDVTADPAAALGRAAGQDALVVVAVPFGAVAAVLDAVAAHAPHCPLTDVVSVKAGVDELVRERGLAGRYVGSHPMAGTADSGWAASRAGLFTGAAWVIGFDPGRATPEWTEAWRDVAAMIAVTGAEVVPARAFVHDAAVARVSHLPHVLAEALAVVGDRGGALAHSLAAGSFRDATRVAATAPGLVRAMCETNAGALVPALDEAIELLAAARDTLAGPRPDFAALADAGHRSRGRFDARSGAAEPASAGAGPASRSGRPVVRVRPGGTGWLEQLATAEALGARVEIC